MSEITSAVASRIVRGLTQGGGFLSFTTREASALLARGMSYKASLPSQAPKVIEELEGKIKKGYRLDKTFTRILQKARQTRALTQKINALFPQRQMQTY